ncbi:endoplasmic reticulum vesicle transporter-domain-containing protein [Fimicolochytrium jonesii]|uniref:endoplasmic reticulum vesicle transporter-domain-containing protein n=1 Tax=Fimicolochytrium jonesii TaxID=1396493 RepID=UPI0022FE8350|nr:endoplasmic reticulum vesicle transporter-domain-containing protein [Fimicolochytrium jonesii]KAI8820151.1 endoplasmic reticulum vesicle transporter-domain-containing protein [Fimicolochytrium jonesii]
MSLRRRAAGGGGGSGGGGEPSLLERFKGFDAYAKPIEDFRIKTTSGAIVTLASAAVIALLLLSEFIDWRTVTMQPSLEVDKARNEKMTINLNVSLPHVPCYLLSIDVMDVAGEHQNDVDSTIYKMRLDPTGRPIEGSRSDIGDSTKAVSKAAEKAKDPDYCGSCYGAKSPGGKKSAKGEECCNTCDEVQKAYANEGWGMKTETWEQCIREHWAEKVANQSHEGCNLWGRLQVNKVAGNFHLAPGKSMSRQNMHVHDLAPYLKEKDLDFSHTLHSLSFGKKVEFVNPLDGVSKSTKQSYFMFQYFLKVVSTRFTFLNGTNVRTNQFSVTEHERDTTPSAHTGGLPGVFFNYDISPMLVMYTEYQKPLSHFLTDICAVVGGVFTVAGIVDSFIFTAGKQLRQKMELGKST